MLTYRKTYKILERQTYPLLFITISGSHLYGFSSRDSDVDLRGVHILPANELLGLTHEREIPKTIIDEDKTSDYHDELVTHDIKKFIGLMLKRNGSVLEYLYSPLVVYDGGLLKELRMLGTGCITRDHAKHYIAFSHDQMDEVYKGHHKQVKGILYAFRTAMSGIYLMRTGRIESNIDVLNDEFKIQCVKDLLDLKRRGLEKGPLPDNHDIEYYKTQHMGLIDKLQYAYAHSALREEPEGRERLNDLLLRIRKGSL